MECDTAQWHPRAYLSSPGDAVMDLALHLHIHLYSHCAATHQRPLQKTEEKKI